LQACLRLRGGISRNLKFTVTSMPRAKSMKQVSASPWPSPPHPIPCACCRNSNALPTHALCWSVSNDMGQWYAHR
jgi:hypothetical protein